METRGVMAARFVTPLVVIVAAMRVAWWCRRLPLDQLVVRIRQVPVLPESLRCPEKFQKLVNQWYRWLPPRGFRPCLKRSYLLLDLWSRCGLDPKFHLGIRTGENSREGHAWLTVEGFDGAENLEEGYEETFVA